MLCRLPLHPKQTADTPLHVTSGVSYESCHGAAKNWVAVHHDFGGENLTRFDECPAHRTQRIADNMKPGIRNPSNLYAVTQSCLRCHTTADEELVNIGGHSAGILEFEFVSWSAGLGSPQLSQHRWQDQRVEFSSTTSS